MQSRVISDEQLMYVNVSYFPQELIAKKKYMVNIFASLHLRALNSDCMAYGKSSLALGLLLGWLRNII